MEGIKKIKTLQNDPKQAKIKREIGTKMDGKGKETRVTREAFQRGKESIGKKSTGNRRVYWLASKSRTRNECRVTGGGPSSILKSEKRGKQKWRFLVTQKRGGEKNVFIHSQEGNVERKNWHLVS